MRGPPAALTNDGAGGEAVRFPAMPTSPASAGVRGASATPLRQIERTSPDDTFVLAVDLGTGGPKVALLSASGRIAAHTFAPVGVTLTDDGGAEQSPQAWWEAIVSSARRALADSGVAPDRVVGVGCTSQWSGTVAVDGAGDAIGPAIIWMDSRGAQAVRKTVRGALNVQGYSASKAARWVRKTGGIPSLSGKDPVGPHPFPAHPAPRRLRVHCGVPRAGRLPEPPSDRPRPRLGRLHHSALGDGQPRPGGDRLRRHASSSWQDSSARTLPDLVPTGSVLGGLTAGAAEELGLLAGTPVVAGTGDLHSAAVGSGAVADFAAHLYIGTSSWISCHVPFKKTDALTNIASIPSGLPTKYLLADEHETGGACLTWLRDNLLFPGDVLSDAGGGEAGGPGGVPDGFFGLVNEDGRVGPGRRSRRHVHPVAQRRALAGGRPHHPGRVSQHLLVVDAVRHGPGRLRGCRAQLRLAPRGGGQVLQAPYGLARLRRRWRQLGPVVADPRRRHGAGHPPNGGSGARQRAGRRPSHARRPRAHVRSTTSPAPSPSKPPTSPTRPRPSSTRNA